VGGDSLRNGGSEFELLFDLIDSFFFILNGIGSGGCFSPWSRAGGGGNEDGGGGGRCWCTGTLGGDDDGGLAGGAGGLNDGGGGILECSDSDACELILESPDEVNDNFFFL